MKALSLLREELRRSADPKKAPMMQAYMKSSMPYHGVPVPEARKAARRVFRQIDLSTVDAWRAATLGVWRGAEYREERYAALTLAGDRRAALYQTPAAMPMYEEMIVTGAWWDFVDDIAVHRVGTILKSHPAPMRKLMLAWSRCRDLWKRRTSILCQLSFKEETDMGFLYSCIEPSIGSEEFFLRKAIGWALRQCAWRDPDEVLRYVRENEGRLSPLSRREALKNILRAKALS